jgi:hypothetical protein
MSSIQSPASTMVTYGHAIPVVGGTDVVAAAAAEEMERTDVVAAASLAMSW